MRYPYLIRDPAPAEPPPIPPIPPDLAANLSRDAVQSLFNEYSRFMEGEDPEVWWSLGLPYLANELCRQLAASASEVERMRAECAKVEQWTAKMDRLVENNERQLQLSEDDNEELRDKLKLSEVRVEVLSEVLSRKNA